MNAKNVYKLLSAHIMMTDLAAQIVRFEMSVKRKKTTPETSSEFIDSAMNTVVVCSEMLASVIEDECQIED